ncbi:hypothetical protein Tco_0138289 [Tanacetum coccineum]
MAVTCPCSVVNQLLSFLPLCGKWNLSLLCVLFYDCSVLTVNCLNNRLPVSSNDPAALKLSTSPYACPGLLHYSIATGGALDLSRIWDHKGKLILTSPMVTVGLNLCMSLSDWQEGRITIGWLVIVRAMENSLVALLSALIRIMAARDSPMFERIGLGVGGRWGKESGGFGDERPWMIMCEWGSEVVVWPAELISLAFKTGLLVLLCNGLAVSWFLILVGYNLSNKPYRVRTRKFRVSLFSPTPPRQLQLFHPLSFSSSSYRPYRCPYHRPSSFSVDVPYSFISVFSSLPSARIVSNLRSLLRVYRYLHGYLPQDQFTLAGTNFISWVICAYWSSTVLLRIWCSSAPRGMGTIILEIMGLCGHESRPPHRASQNIVVVPPGSVVVPPGSVVVPPGSVVVPPGSVVVPPGSVVTTGSILVTPGSVITTDDLMVYDDDDQCNLNPCLDKNPKLAPMKTLVFLNKP